jgi:hypothetical protein
VQDENSSALSLKVPFYDNFGDNYTAIVFSDGYQQAGFTPLKLSPSVPTNLDLMLIPKDGQPNFARAPWDFVKTELPFLVHGVSDADGKSRYETLVEQKPLALAALLNITTAMS